MSFNVAADAYDRFMGRFSRVLAPQFAEFAGVQRGQRVLDVGCGPGALTTELVERLGAGAVSAVDPSQSFVAAAGDRHPGVTVLQASAEQLPFDDDSFDATLAQLVVHFMSDPIAGLREMARVATKRGVVAACVWDHAGRRGPLTMFWEAAHELDPRARDESRLPGAREGHLAELLASAGLDDVEEEPLRIGVQLATFDEWWSPFTEGVGPAGAFVARLDPDRRAKLRELCRARFPTGPFVLEAYAWAARGLA